jgi:hypothetical protein
MLVSVAAFLLIALGLPAVGSFIKLAPVGPLQFAAVAVLHSSWSSGGDREGVALPEDGWPVEVSRALLGRHASYDLLADDRTDRLHKVSREFLALIAKPLFFPTCHGRGCEDGLLGDRAALNEESAFAAAWTRSGWPCVQL